MSDERHRRQQEALVTLTGSDVLSGDDLALAFRRITEVDATTLNVARSSIWRYNQARTAIVCEDLFDPRSGTHSSGTELLAVDFPSYFSSMAGSRVLAVDDARADPRTCEFTASYLTPLGITSMMDAPFHVGGRVEGVLCREHVGAIRHWTSDETAFAVAVANLLSLAVAGAERRRAEAVVRLQGAALNAAANAMVITDRDGTIEWVNPAFTATTGYSRDESVGRNPRDLVRSGVHGQAHYQDLWEAVLSGRVWRGELINRRKDGTLYPVELTITPILAATGEIGHFIAVQRDLTEEKRLEAQFLHSQKMEIVGRLAGGIAHDFNNLLTVINGTADLLTTILPADDPHREDLRQIQHAGAQAASLTRQLLAFSRKQVASPETVYLGTLVRDWRGMLQRLIGEDVDLTVSHSDPVSAIRADPGQIEQVLMNLAVNARDAMPDGGRLTLDVRDVVVDSAHPAIQPGVRPGAYVLLTVTDTGVGMDATVRARIFEPFFTTKEQGKGTGLGLAVVFGIVQQSGGAILVDSEPGQGTAFKVYLPRFASQPGPQVASPSTPSRGHERIVVVEDDANLRLLVTRILTAAGYQVVATGTAHEALALFETDLTPVDVLFTDVVLPRMNGRELADRVMALRPGITVLFTSGYTDDAILRYGVQDDTAHFIGKPFTAAELTHMIRALIDRSSPPAPPS